MTLGPLEYLVIGFADATIDGSVAREIEKVVQNKTIKLVDVVFIARDEHDEAVILELDNKDDPRFASISHLLGDRMALFTPEDLVQIAASLPPKTAGLVLLFEHHWAVDIKKAMEAKGAFLVGRAVIPPEVLEELSDELEAAEAAALAAGATA